MERDVQFPSHQPSVGLRRRIQTDQNERRLLPDELCHRRALHSVPEPSVASDLSHRLHRHDGRLVVPLLPPRRASGDFQPHDQRSSGDDRSVGCHDHSTVVDSRHAQHIVIAFDWSGDCCDSRVFEKNR